MTQKAYLFTFKAAAQKAQCIIFSCGAAANFRGYLALTGVFITAVVSFISTNIDNIFIVMFQYAQVGDKMKKSDIVIGQYLSTGLLVIISILGAFGLQLLPQKYIGFLGFVPIALGVNAWLDSRKESEGDDTEEATEGTGDEAAPSRLSGLLGKFMSPQVLTVFLVGIANGADNIGIYTPIFTGYSGMELAITSAIYAVMLGLWCVAGDKLANFPLVKDKIEKYQHIIVPVVFIGLGVLIILRSGLIDTLFGG